MKIKSCIFCENLINKIGEKIIAENIFSSFYLSTIPCKYTFSVFFILYEIKNKNTPNLKLCIINPQNETIVNIPITFEGFNWKEFSGVQNESKVINIGIEIKNINFKSTGKYTINILNGEKKLYKDCFYVEEIFNANE